MDIMDLKLDTDWTPRIFKGMEELWMETRAARKEGRQLLLPSEIYIYEETHEPGDFFNGQKTWTVEIHGDRPVGMFFREGEAVFTARCLQAQRLIA
jgi:hypothetical protein